MLSVRKLSKSYQTPEGPVAVLQGASLTLEQGQSMALMGESGSGKSTLLHLIAGLDRADSGQILFTPQGLTPCDITALKEAERAQLRRHHIGLVFQQFNLVPSLTVGQNLGFAARLKGNADPDWIAELAAKLDLAHALNRYPEQLSGGQQQRLAVGRTFAAKPHLVLADEPTGNLDEDTSDRVLDLAFDLVRETGCGLLMVTHARRIAERTGTVLRLDHGVLK